MNSKIGGNPIQNLLLEKTKLARSSLMVNNFNLDLNKKVD